MTMKSLGIYLTEDEIDELIDKYDENGDCQFDIDEFRTMVRDIITGDIDEHTAANPIEHIHVHANAGDDLAAFHHHAAVQSQQSSDTVGSWHSLNIGITPFPGTLPRNNSHQSFGDSLSPPGLLSPPGGVRAEGSFESGGMRENSPDSLAKMGSKSPGRISRATSSSSFRRVGSAAILAADLMLRQANVGEAINEYGLQRMPSQGLIHLKAASEILPKDDLITGLD